MAQGNVIPTSAAGGPSRLPARSLGAILVDAGRLKPADTDRILRFQQERGLQFGDAALELGLLTRADIDFALSQQFQHPYLERGQSLIRGEVVAAYSPFGRQVEGLRALRNQLLIRWFESDPAHTGLAIVSAGRGEGRSFIAANLAVLFSQLGERTLLVDADMRSPAQHLLFGFDNRAGLSALLSGRGGPDLIRRVPSLPELCVLPAGAQPPNPSELLARSVFARFVQQMAGEFDVVLFDTPAAGEWPEALTVCLRAGAGLIVVRKNATRTWRVRGVADGAAQSSAVIIGTVLNNH
ncbi:MAG: chain length determinant protein tyrosine kinase EpsG [Steroidobacteraceae bacterium]